MDFKKIAIGTTIYGTVTEDQPHYISNADYADFPDVTNVDFRDRRLIDIINNENSPEYKTSM